jgi:hypothetical protein
MLVYAGLALVGLLNVALWGSLWPGLLATPTHTDPLLGTRAFMLIMFCSVSGLAFASGVVGLVREMRR